MKALFPVAAFFFASVANSATVLWDEAIDGDIADRQLVLSAESDINWVSGSVSEGDADRFYISLSPSQELISVEVISYGCFEELPTNGSICGTLDISATGEDRDGPTSSGLGVRGSGLSGGGRNYSIFGPSTTSAIGAAAASNNGFDWYAKITVVPIPAAVWLFGSALAVSGWAGRGR
jgi:hypothetical protein